jgi:hypothetical protein
MFNSVYRDHTLFAASKEKEREIKREEVRYIIIVIAIEIIRRKKTTKTR